jgi:hypothetical protein
MQKLFTDKERNIAFGTLRAKVASMEPSFDELGTLLQFLDREQMAALLGTIELKTSSTDIIKLFEKLSKEQINDVLPLLESKMAAYLSKVDVEVSTALLSFLKSKITEEPVLARIFPTSSSESARSTPTASSTGFKERLAGITDEALDADGSARKTI